MSKLQTQLIVPEFVEEKIAPDIFQLGTGFFSLIRTDFAAASCKAKINLYRMPSVLYIYRLSLRHPCELLLESYKTQEC